MKSNKLAGFANNESLVVVHDLEYSFCKKSNKMQSFFKCTRTPKASTRWRKSQAPEYLIFSVLMFHDFKLWLCSWFLTMKELLFSLMAKIY